MLTCPMCKKKLRSLQKECGNCKADVSLLVDYVVNLGGGIQRAEGFTKSGELGEAVWAYLEVLEVDPDNETARRQVGRVVTAVREFDNHSEGRQWLKALQKRGRFQRWLGSWSEEGDLSGCLTSLFWIMLVLCAFSVGFMLGLQRGAKPTPTQPSNSQPKKDPGKSKQTLDPKLNKPKSD